MEVMYPHARTMTWFRYLMGFDSSLSQLVFDLFTCCPSLFSFPLPFALAAPAPFLFLAVLVLAGQALGVPASGVLARCCNGLAAARCRLRSHQNPVAPRICRCGRQSVHSSIATGASFDLALSPLHSWICRFCRW